MVVCFVLASVLTHLYPLLKDRTVELNSNIILLVPFGGGTLSVLALCVLGIFLILQLKEGVWVGSIGQGAVIYVCMYF